MDLSIDILSSSCSCSFQMSRFSIAILHYLETEIDYRPFILFCRVMSQDYAQEISGCLDKIEGLTVIFFYVPYYNNISVRITFNYNAEGLSPPQELEGGMG